MYLYKTSKPKFNHASPRLLPYIYSYICSYSGFYGSQSSGAKVLIELKQLSRNNITKNVCYFARMIASFKLLSILFYLFFTHPIYFDNMEID